MAPNSPKSSSFVALPSIDSLFNDSWTLYKKNVWNYFLILVLPVAITVVFLLVVLPLVSSMDSRAASIVLQIIIWIVMIFLSIWGNTALFSSMKANYAGTALGFGTAYKTGWPKIIPYFLTRLLTSFVIIGGMLFFFIPGAILAVKLMFSQFVVIDSDSKGLGAIFQSKTYTSGNWFGMVARILLLGIVLVVIFYAIVGFIALISAIIGFATFNFTVVTIVGGVIGGLTALFLIIYAYTYIWTLFEKTKALKSSAVAPKPRTLYIVLSVIGGILFVLYLLASFLFAGIGRSAYPYIEPGDEELFQLLNQGGGLEGIDFDTIEMGDY